MSDKTGAFGSADPIKTQKSWTEPLRAAPGAKAADVVAPPPAEADALGTSAPTLAVPSHHGIDLDGITDVESLASTTRPAVAVNVPNAGLGKTLAAAGVGAGTASVIDNVHSELQSSKKALESLRKIREGVDRLRNGEKSVPAERAPAEPVPAKPLLAPLSKPLTGLLKAFEIAKVAKGIDAGFGLYFDAKVLAKDIRTGEFKAAGLDVIKTLSDGLSTLQGAESGLKLAGKEVTFLQREVSVLGGVAKKVPILSVAYAGVDLTSKGIELYRGVNSAGKPLPTTKKVADAAAMIADVAILVAAVTPPPIDVAAGLVAAGASLVQLGADHFDKVKALGGAIGQGAASVEQAGARLLAKVTKFW